MSSLPALKILHFAVGRCSLESPNGVDKTIFYLSREQAALGAQVGVFCFTAKPIRPIPGVDVQNFAPPRTPFVLPRKLRDAVDAWAPDFIHIHSAYLPPNIAMARFARSRNIRYAVTAHGNLSSRLLRRKPWFKIPYKILFERPMFNRAAFVHAIADEADIRAFGVTRPLVTAPNGFDLNDVISTADHDIHAEFPAFRDKKLLLYLGRLDVEQKGLDVLLEALAILAERHPDLHLALAGSTWKDGRPRLEALARKLGMQDRVTFCGTVHGGRKFALMKACHLFLHPSRWEAGVPFAVMEALACGKPCVVSPAADPLNRLKPAGAGVIAGPRPSDLADAIARIAAAPAETLAAMSQAATTLIEREFDWRQTAGKILRAYQTS